MKKILVGRTAQTPISSQMRAAGGSHLRAALAAAVRNKASMIRSRSTDGEKVISHTGNTGNGIACMEERSPPITGLSCMSDEYVNQGSAPGGDMKSDQMYQVPVAVVEEFCRDARYEDELTASKAASRFERLSSIVSSNISRKYSFRCIHRYFSQWNVRVADSALNRIQIAQLSTNRRRAYLRLSFKMWALLKQEKAFHGHLKKLGRWLSQRSSVYLTERIIFEWRSCISTGFQMCSEVPTSPNSFKISRICAPVESLMDTMEQSLSSFIDVIEKQLFCALSIVDICLARMNFHISNQNCMIEVLEGRIQELIKQKSDLESRVLEGEVELSACFEEHRKDLQKAGAALAAAEIAAAHAYKLRCPQVAFDELVMYKRRYESLRCSNRIHDRSWAQDRSLACQGMAEDLKDKAPCLESYSQNSNVLCSRTFVQDSRVTQELETVLAKPRKPQQEISEPIENHSCNHHGVAAVDGITSDSGNENSSSENVSSKLAFAIDSALCSCINVEKILICLESALQISSLNACPSLLTDSKTNSFNLKTEVRSNLGLARDKRYIRRENPYYCQCASTILAPMLHIMDLSVALCNEMKEIQQIATQLQENSVRWWVARQQDSVPEPATMDYQLDRYEAECKLLQLWEGLALLENSSQDFCNDKATNAEDSEMVSGSVIPFKPPSVALVRDFESGQWPEPSFLPENNDPPRHRWSSIAWLAVSLSIDMSRCSRLCEDLAADLPGCVTSVSNKGAGPRAWMLDVGPGQEYKEAAHANGMATTGFQTSCLACSGCESPCLARSGCESCAHRQQLEHYVRELEDANLRAERLENEVRHYREEEERLSLQAMEREEELEAALLQKMQLAETQIDLAARLARAQGRIQELKDINRSLVRARPAVDASTG